MAGVRDRGSPAIAEAEERISFARLMVHDFHRLDEAQEESAARERIRAIDPVPAFFLCVHLVCGLGLMIGLGGAAWQSIGIIAPLGILLAADLAGWLWLRKHPPSRMQPHSAIRGAALYTLATTLIWCATAVIANVAIPHAANPLLTEVAFAGAVLAVPFAFLSFPALAALGAIGCVAKLLFLSGDAAATLTTFALALFLVCLSLTRSAERMVQLKRRVEIDWNAQRAARFIEEFEQAGRGWFWETTARGALSYVSEQLAADLKTPAAELIGKSFHDLIGLDDRRSPEASERSLGFHLSTRLPFTDINVRANTAAEIWWSLSGTPSFDEYGRFLGFRGIGTDLTQQRRSEEEINRLAKYDSLTGLPNRSLMRRTLDEAMQSKDGGGCALFLIDLDRFKNVNDTLGHPIGDALLKQVGQRLTAVLGKGGQVGRLGGDEFKAVLPSQHDNAFLGELASRLIQQVSMPYTIEGHNISIGASVGIALAAAGRDCADALIRNADLALYSAKAAGRGTYCFFAPEMHSEAQDRQILETDLRKAIARGELQLQYQPVVNAKTEELSGFEALVRWHHPTRGLISPALFIPLAEEAGLILSIGEWVLRTACLEASKWPEHIRVAVNLSPIQFVEPSLPETIISALAHAELPPRQLELEITEGVFLVESESTDDMFAKLKQIGVRLALDDFGTGYSSLGYLKKAPFDKIKIDQSFVRGAAKDGSRNAAIIRAIVTLAESLNMDTTAEGAETHDELTMIRQLGCSHIQGYIFGRPMNPDEAGRLAAENKAITADGFQFNRPPRQGLLKVASLQFDGMSMPVRVRNISSGGALLECDRSLPNESKVQLDLPGCGNLGAEVRWTESRRIGLQFEEEFDLRRLAPGKGKSFGARLPQQGYTNLRFAEGAADKKALTASDLRYDSDTG